MNPLETVLGPVASLLNRNIAESTPARELCARLDGKLIAVRVQDSGLAMYFDIDDGVVALRAEADAEPDAIICAPLLTLARMASSGGAAELRDGSVDFTGDARTAAAFQRAMRELPPPSRPCSASPGPTWKRNSPQLSVTSPPIASASSPAACAAGRVRPATR
jgi:ubiquinone biosynthesis protein UbiJ